MNSSSTKLHHMTECGRVYYLFNQENINLFSIKCILCQDDFSEWAKFYKHFKTFHQLKQIPIGNNVVVQNDKQEILTNSDLKDRFYHKNQQQLDNDCFNIEYLEEELDNSVEENLGYGNSTSKTESCSKNKISSCFFRLCSTDKKSMLTFIELLRQHPSQWEDQNGSLSIKEKRHGSTTSLTKQLNEILNINVNEQGTRASVMSILRWFDREYLRYLNCQRNDFQFVCMHKEYFFKLLEFLPHKHLKPTTCDKCLKHFKSEHLFMAHDHKYHNGQIPFRCRYCGHGFIHQSSHKMHENRHIKIDIWPCKICRYQATSKSDNIKHLATHSTQQPYKCVVCGLAYKTRSNLNVHLKSHGLPDYECEFCKKKFYQKYRYKRHIWQHEKQEKSNRSIDNFTCEMCGRRFASHKTLQRHQLVHVQENYKIANNANKIFKLTDVIVYFCDHCSLEFLYKEAYETHMILKHNETIIKEIH